MNLMDVIAKAKAEKATSLDLSQQDLRILPKELFDIESCTWMLLMECFHFVND